VPVALMAALLYDDRARAAALDLLGGLRSRLPEIWRRAALDGVRDLELRDFACKLWEIGLDGMQALPSGYVAEDHITATRAYLDHFTDRGRTPGDDLLELNDEDPAVALEWASS